MIYAIIFISIITAISFIIMFVCFKIDETKWEKEFKERIMEMNKKIERYKYELNERERIKTKLLESLQTLAKKFGIPVSYHESLGDAAGQIVYYRNKSGRFLLDDVSVQILNKHEDSPYVLAHELGHYVSLVDNDNNSEESADKEAMILCKSFLTSDEIEIMRDTLNVYFDIKSFQNKIEQERIIK